MFNKPMQAPSPNLGDCSKKGQWSDKSFVDLCKQCVTEPDMFFCNGECMNRYDMNSMCPNDSLVAKTTEQCEMPCVQDGFPTIGGGCSDKFDCDWKGGETCVVKSDKKRGMVGTCMMSNSASSSVVKNCKDSTECDTKNHEFCSIVGGGGVGICKKEMFSKGVKIFIMVAILVFLAILIALIISSAKSKRMEKFDNFY